MHALSGSVILYLPHAAVSTGEAALGAFFLNCPPAIRFHLFFPTQRVPSRALARRRGPADQRCPPWMSFGHATVRVGCRPDKVSRVKLRSSGHAVGHRCLLWNDAATVLVSGGPFYSLLCTLQCAPASLLIDGATGAPCAHSCRAPLPALDGCRFWV